MDLESVHMEYLAESLDICFLSEETRDIGGIIRNILQCAVDFRGTIYGGAWSTGGQGDLSVNEPIINFSQKKIVFTQNALCKACAVCIFRYCEAFNLHDTIEDRRCIIHKLYELFIINASARMQR
ncbi:hypothetical protein EUGRSUZ_B03796, partial [Eucalyptus grandis]